MATILVIEDDVILQGNIVATLTYNDYEAITANNGFEGLEIATMYLPDLIISDVIMPEMNGYEMLDKLRESVRTASIPIVFLSAKADETDRRQGMERGADDYLTKPFNEAQLLASVESRLHRQATHQIHQLRTISQELVRVHDETRRNLAQQLQNDVIQKLSGLKMGLNTLASSQPENPILNSVKELAGTIEHQIERLVQDLWPIMIEQLGLLSSLLWQVDALRTETRRNIFFQHRDIPKSLPIPIETTTFYIIQDCLSRAVKTPGLGDISLQLWLEDSVLHIRVESQDVELHSLYVEEGNPKIEYWVLHERIIAAGGELSISNYEDNVFSINVRLPLESDALNLETLPSPGLLPEPADLWSKTKSSSSTQNIPKFNRQRVALIIDNILVSSGIKHILDQTTDMKIVADTSKYENGLKLINDLKPDLLIADLRLEGSVTFNFIEKTKNLYPNLKLIILAYVPQEIYVVEALRRGADGYILSDSTSNEIIKAIETVNSGKQYLSPTLSQERIEHLLESEVPTNTLDSYSSLTEREREVLKLVAEGHSNAKIADILVISKRTVESHRSRMINKLGLRTKVDLLRYATKLGLIQLDS